MKENITNREAGGNCGAGAEEGAHNGHNHPLRWRCFSASARSLPDGAGKGHRRLTVTHFGLSAINYGPIYQLPCGVESTRSYDSLLHYFKKAQKIIALK